ncbi:MAG: hypothetical protein AAFP90_03540 [Planctomycetota bacterium]
MDHRFRVVSDDQFDPEDKGGNARQSGDHLLPSWELGQQKRPMRKMPADRQKTLRLSDLAPLVANAEKENLAWLHDFGDEPIIISEDLYEIVQAYENMRRRDMGDQHREAA